VGLWVDYDENEDRIALQELQEAILQHADACTSAEARLSAKWAALLAITVPQDLYAAMVDHQATCNEVLSLKDNVIGKLRDVVSKKEAGYVKTLKAHAEVRLCTMTCIEPDSKELGPSHVH